MSAKPVVLPEGWQLLTLNSRPFQLWDYAAGHPSLPGFQRHIYSSRVLRLDDDRREAETLNTVYRLRRGIREVLFEDADPIEVQIADLTAERDPSAELWIVRRDGAVLASGLATMTAAILAMLAILDPSASDTAG
jgi:hypothetical protein